MADERCKKTDLLTDQCSHCTGRDGGEKREREFLLALAVAPGWMAAQYAGICSNCSEGIGVGEPICWVATLGWCCSCQWQHERTRNAVKLHAV